MFPIRDSDWLCFDNPPIFYSDTASLDELEYEESCYSIVDEISQKVPANFNSA